jgi:YesN/AraC family two-component response regulator
MNSQIKIALIDDEQLILEGVKMLLSSEPNISVGSTSTNGPDFLETLEKTSEEDFPILHWLMYRCSP